MYINLHDLETAALTRLDQNARDYYSSGANDGITLRENQAAFGRLRLRPRVLVDVSAIDTSTTLLGLPLASPIAAAPTAYHGLAHPEAELATARGCAAGGGLMVLSTLSNTALEEVATAAAGRWWFQLYVMRQRALAEALLERVAAAGAKALVLTVDTPALGAREIHARRPFQLPAHLGLPNGGVPLGQISASIDPSLDWQTIAWLRARSDLPLVLKGILTAEDAMLAVEHGVEAIIVSNHGGRQLDGATATIEALPEIVAAVAGRAEIYLDGGVRRGTDVLKALALGAKAVFLGRPVLWGLTVDGESGVRQVFELLHQELKLAMMLTGQVDVKAIAASVVKLGAF
jgi:isopentenyl diphosphate isomerase/L-lactate dehydrogenase-like FMN-dependent dehydrogenase